MATLTAATKVKAPPERVPAYVHNRIVVKALKRADALEARMVDVLQPILEAAGRKAAAGFLASVTDHLSAAGLDVGAAETMIALKPRPEEAAAIEAASSIPADRLHITLALLGETEGDLGDVRDALAPVGARYAPLVGEIAGGGFFGDPGGGGPEILLPDVRGLVEVRVAVTEALAGRGIDYARDHGFEAHLTVSYRDDDGETDPYEWPVGAPLHFDAILIVRGDEVIAEIPLVGTPALTAAATPPPWSAPFPDQVIDVASLVANIRAKTEPVRKAFVEAAMTPALKEAGLSFDVTNPLTAKVLAGSAAKVTNIAETTRLNVMRIIRASYDNGLSIPQTATAIRAGMSAASGPRATMIARTELTAAVSGGSLAATSIVADATGSSYSKRWLTAPGAQYPRHELYEGLDGQTVPLDEPFDVGGSPCMYPGDPDGDEAETINCRCSLAYDEGGGEQIVDGENAPDFNVGGSDANAVANAPVGGAFDDISVGDGPPIPGDVIAKIKANGLDLPLDDLRPTTDVGRQVFASAPNTEAMFKVGGTWSPEREALHQDIVSSFFADKTEIPAVGEKKAFFTAGGGASGKSRAVFDFNGEEIGTFRDPVKDADIPFGSFLSDRPDTITIDPDRIKEMLPEYRKLRDANDLFAASGVHEESSMLAKVITKMAYDRGYTVLLDTTGGSSKFLAKIEEAKALGYETHVTMFSIPTNTAIVRAMERGDRSGRYVSIEALKEAHKGASAGLGVWKDSKVVDDWRLYDGLPKVPDLVAEGGMGTKPVLWDEAKFKEIAAKAIEGPHPVAVPPPSTATTLERLMPGPKPDAVAAVAKTHMTKFDAFARDVPGVESGKVYREKLDAKIADAVKAAPIRIRVDPNSLVSILGDGRFKTQIETGTSKGLLAPSYRMAAEKTMFGYDVNLDPTLRPIYGYLGGSTKEDYSGTVQQFGAHIVVVKDSLRDRATFALTDSLGPGSEGRIIPQPLVGSKMPSLAIDLGSQAPTAFNPLAKDSLSGLSDYYAEVQLHGGVDVNDISEVIFDGNALANAAETATTAIDYLTGYLADLKEAVGSGKLVAADARAKKILEIEKNLEAERARLAAVENGGALLKERLDTLGIPYRTFSAFDTPEAAALLNP